MPVSRKKRILSNFEELKKRRNPFEKEWMELTEFIQPRYGRYHITDHGQQNRTYKKIVNSRGTIASRTLASGLMSGLTSPARPWFELGTPDPDMTRNPEVKEWLRRLTKLMFQTFAAGNLYQVLPSVYMELGLFGTACMTHVDDPLDVARFYHHTAGTYAISQNDRLKPDRLIRELTMTAVQMESRFGRENLSVGAQRALTRGDLYGRYEILHVVEPNADYVEGSPLEHQLAYRSVYLEKAGVSQDKMLGVSGFHEVPFYAPRWGTTDSDDYGTMCPGMAALGDIKALQILEKEKAIGIQKKNDPPLRGPSSLKNYPVASIPGGVTLFDSNPQAGGLEPVYQVAPELRETEESIKAHEARIDEAFYADLFKQLANLHGVQPRNELELSQREQEKLLQLGPLLERAQGDLLDPLVDRTANQIFRAGLMPEPPEELLGQRLRVTYISPLAVAQRQAATGTVDRVVAFVGGLAQLDPNALDNLNSDEAVNEYQTLLGAPPRIIRSPAEVQAIREAREQQIAQAQQAEQLSMAADAAGKVGVDVSQQGS